MNIPITLSMTEDQHKDLQHKLFPGDGKEAVAILLCGRRDGDRRQRLLVRDIHLIPYKDCSIRTPTQVTWSPELISDLLNQAELEGLSLVKVHSHPCGYADFSPTDDKGDRILLPMIKGWVEADIPHGSAVMLPNGEMFGRIIQADKTFTSISSISVVGNDLHFWYPDAGSVRSPSFVASHKQAFGEGTTEQLGRLSAAVIGCSGTGSPTIEQLMRLGIGEIITVDDDHMEERNVNRIINATMGDAKSGRNKAHVARDAINRAGLGTKIIAISENLWNPDVIRQVSQCDVVFGCMDSIDGRFLLNLLATHYTIPYFDVGIRLDAVPDGIDKGRIRAICGSVHYLQPGRSSLMSRGLFDMKKVVAAGLYRKDQNAFQSQLDAGYISGIEERRPAVISVNMFASSLMVNEFLARLHPYRFEPNNTYAKVEFSLSDMELYLEPEEGICKILSSFVGHGDRLPLLGLPELSERKVA